MGDGRWRSKPGCAAAFGESADRSGSGRQTPIQQLLALQREDGGWAQTLHLASDAVPTPLEIIRSGGDVVLQHEWMDVRRTVHMSMQAHPKDSARTSLGHSIGHFDGETLVIETANYAAGVLNQ